MPIKKDYQQHHYQLYVVIPEESEF